MLNLMLITCKIPHKANSFKSEKILSHLSASVTIKYSFVPNCRREGGGRIKSTREGGGGLSRFLEMGRVCF